MTEKSYACTYECTDLDGDRVLVYRSFDYTGTAQAEIHVEDNLDTQRTNYAYVTKEQAPALALAVLEAAGYESTTAADVCAGYALDYLREHFRRQS